MASKKIGVVLALDGQREFANGVSNANKQAQLLKNQLKGLTQEFDGQQNSMAALTAKQANLIKQQQAYKDAAKAAASGLKDSEKALEEQKKQLEKLPDLYKKTQAELKKYVDAGDKQSDGYKAAKKACFDLNTELEKQKDKIAKTEGTIISWNAKVEKAKYEENKLGKELDITNGYIEEAKNSVDGCAVSIDGFGNRVKESTDGIGDANENLEGLGGTVTSVGDIISGVALGDLLAEGVKKLGEAAIEAAKYVVEVGSSFEASMSKVEAISGATGEELSKMEEMAKSLGRTTKFSASEVADGFSYMSLAGWSTAEMIDGITGVVNLAAAADMDLAKASDMVTDYLSAFGLEASNAGKMADMMATAQAKSNTSAEQLGSAWGNCATNLHNAGQSIEDVTAILEGMANVGDKGSSAGTGLSAVMAQITKEMDNGTIAIGKTKVQVADAEGNFRSLIDIMRDVQSATAGMGSAEQAAALSTTFNRTSLSAVNEILAAGVDNIANYSEELKNCDGAAQDMADTMQNNLKGKLAELGSATEGLGVAAYNYISGPLEGAVDVMTGLITGITEAITPQKTALQELVDVYDDAVGRLKAVSEEVDDIETETDSKLTDLSLLSTSILGLGTDSKKSAGEIALMNGYVERLSKYIPEIVEYYDAERGVLSLTNTEFKHLVNNKKAYYGNSSNEKITKIETDAFKEQGEVVDALNASYETLKKQSEGFEGFSNLENGPVGEINAIMSSLEGLRASDEQIEYMRQLVYDYWATYENGAYASSEAALQAYEMAEKWIASSDASSPEKIQEMLGAFADASYQWGISSEEARKQTEKAVDEEEALGEKLEETKTKGKDSRSALTNGMSEYMASQQEALENEELLANKRNEIRETEVRKEKQRHGEIYTNSHILGQTYRDIAAGLKDVADAHGGEVTAEQAAQVAADAYKDALDRKATSQEQAKKRAEELANIEKEAAKTQVEAAEEVTDAYESAYDSIKGKFESKISLFDAFEADSSKDMTVEQMTANLDSQIAAFQDYQEKLAKVKDHVGKEISPQFMQYIENMGVEGAAILDHILITFADNEPEKVKKMNDRWLQAFNMVDGIARVEALNKTALDAAIGNLGSSEFEFDALHKNISDAISGAISGVDASWTTINEGMKERLQAMVIDAKYLGVQIPDGLAEGIRDGSYSYEEVMSQLSASINGYGEGLANIARQMGIEVPKNISDGIAAGGDSAVGAINELLSLILGSDATVSYDEKGAVIGVNIGQAIADGMDSQSEAVQEAGVALTTDAQEAADAGTETIKTAGENVGNAFGEGIDSTKDTVTEKAKNLSSAATDALSSVATFTAKGKLAGTEYAKGITSSQMIVSLAANSLVNAARTALSNTGDFNSIGYNMAAGIAEGLRSGNSILTNAARHIILVALNTMKETSKIHSPSRLFRDEVGAQIAAGTAFGISDKASLAGKEATKMSNLIYDNAVAWMAKYAAAHQVSISEEQWYWSQVIKHVKSGTTAYTKAYQQMIDAQARAAQGDNHLGLNVNKSLASNFGVDRYNYSTKTTTKKGKTTTKTTKTAKDDESYYSEVLSAASKYMEHMQVLNNLSLNYQVRYWTEVKAQLKEGTDAWYDATKKIQDLEKEQKAEREKNLMAWYDNTDDYLRKKDIENNSTRSDRFYYEQWLEALQAIEIDGGMYSEAWYKAKEKVNQYLNEIDARLEKTNEDAIHKFITDVDDLQKRAFIENHGVAASSQEILSAWKLAAENLEAMGREWTDDWIDAMTNYYTLKNQMDADDANRKKNNASALLDNYQKFYKMTDKQIAQYYEHLLNFTDEGTEEYLEYEAQITQYKASHIEQRKALDEQYAKDTEEINNKLKESVDDLKKAYDDSVESRTKDIMSQMSLFQEWDSESESGEKLLYNLKTQVAGLASWQEELAKLKGKVSEELYEELLSQGSGATASLYALNSLTDEQLAEYDNLYKEKLALAKSQAIKDNEKLHNETNEEIDNLQKDAMAKLADINAEYLISVEELEQDISGVLIQGLVEALSLSDEDITGIVNKVRDTTRKLIEQGSQAIKEVADSSYSLNGYSVNYESILNVPEEDLKVADRSGEIIGDEFLNSITNTVMTSDVYKKISSSYFENLRTELDNEFKNLNFASISDINADVAYSVKTDNSNGADKVVSAISSMNQNVQNMIEALSNLQVILDTGETVGALSGPIGEALAKEISVSTGVRW